jgi:hypothetical protein
MARMKLHVLKRLIDRTRKPEEVARTQVVESTEVMEQNFTDDGFDEKVLAILQTALRVPQLPMDKPVSFDSILFIYLILTI